MRIISTIVIAAFLTLILGCSDTESLVGEGADGFTEEATTSEEPAQLADIPIGQSILISINVSGCYEDSKHLFRLTAGDQFTVETSGNFTNLLPAKGDEPESVSNSGLVTLSKEDIARLDNALNYYRAASPSGHYARDMEFKIEWPHGDEVLQVDGIAHDLTASDAVLPFLELPAMAACEDDR